jgi:hypothetical protein
MPQISEDSLSVPLNSSGFGGFIVSIHSTHSPIVLTMQHIPSPQLPRIELPFESLMKLKMQLRRSRHQQNERVRQLRSRSVPFGESSSPQLPLHRSID